jgi:hypothetical protein
VIERDKKRTTPFASEGIDHKPRIRAEFRG